MIVRLNENNTLELTDKAMIIRDFREMYNYYVGKLRNDDRAMAAFGVMYYMYYFDSQFLIEYPDDEQARFKAVKEFVFKGNEITEIKVYKKAAETYQTLMDQEQTSLYVVMKANIAKIKEYAENMILIKPKKGVEPGEEPDTIKEDDDKGIYVTFTEFSKVNDSLPSHEENLRKFKERLQEYFKSEVDVYGGGELGAYEGAK